MKDNWISVKDRLPKTETEVLFYNKKYDYVTHGKFYEIQKIFDYDQDYDHLIEVSHWMPMPEKPTED